MSEAGDAFQIMAPSGRGPGVLVLHSAWGLTDGTRDFCRSLSDEGFTVVAPDLLDGVVASTSDEAERQLQSVDPSRLTVLVQAGARALYAAGRDPGAKMAVIGFSMGGSLAFWAGARLATIFDRSVSYCGAQSIDFAAAEGPFLGHFGELDPLVSEDDRTYTESLIRLGGNDSEFYLYDGVNAGFAEPGHLGYDESAADKSFARTIEFLHGN
jgi:carboxymethylenebutenolidase